jgi:hypothetical protein
VDSVATLQRAMLGTALEGEPERVLERVQKSLKGVASAVSIVDAGLYVAGGIRILASDDGELAYELRQHRRSRAELLEAKAVLQIATATAGAAMAVESLVVLGGASSAGSLTALTGPVGLMIICGELLITAIDGALDMTKPYTGLAAEIEASCDTAGRMLFSDASGSRLNVCADLDLLARAT